MSDFIGELPRIYVPEDLREKHGELYAKLKDVQARCHRYLAHYVRTDVKPSTKLDYERKVRHLEVVFDVPIGSLSFKSIFQIMWTSSRSFYANRSALVFVCLGALKNGVAVLEDEKRQRAADARMKIVRMKNALRHLDEIAPIDPDEEQREDYAFKIMVIKTAEASTRSRRGNMRELNQIGDWLGDVWHVAAKTEHAALIAVLILTGCRPAELLHGVRIRREGRGLVIRLQGAKVRDGETAKNQTGQAWREIEVDLQTEPARYLESLISNARPILIVGSDFKKSFVDRARELRRLVDEIGGKALGAGVSLSPYDFRHAFSAFLKADDTLDHTEIAKALGQRSTSSQTHYGTARQVGSAQRSRVVGVQAASEVRVPKPRKWGNGAQQNGT